MNLGHFYAVLLLGSNFQRAKNFKKGLLLLEGNYKILARSHLYKSDDILQKGKFYWNLGVLIELQEISLLKNDMLKIEKECKRKKRKFLGLNYLFQLCLKQLMIQINRSQSLPKKFWLLEN
mgnify:CR=1 FL=1